MHSSELHGTTFHYNGDYSGTIKIDMSGGIHTDIAALTNIALSKFARPRTMFRDVYGDPCYVSLKAIKDFVAESIRMDAISKLEQMDSDELLSNEFVKDMATKRIAELRSLPAATWRPGSGSAHLGLS